MDWSSSGRIDAFRYVRVSWQTWEETEELFGITGGSLDRNSSTALKCSGSLDYIEEPHLGSDLVRVYSNSRLPATGEHESIAHGTFIVATPSCTYRGEIEEGTADLYSVLHVLAQDAFDSPFVIPAGSKAVEQAAQIVRSANLRVIASDSSATLNETAVFDESKTSKLDIVNWLMDFAGFESADVDGFGNVLLRPYASPANRKPTFALRDDDRCVFRSGVEREYDTFDVPNVVILTRSNSNGDPLTASAVNDDPQSAFSTVTRGRRIVHTESISDIEDASALRAKAQAVLAAKTAAVEGFVIEHAYLPFDMGDVCDFSYQKAGVQHDDLVAVKQSMALRPGMICKTSFQRFPRR